MTDKQRYDAVINWFQQAMPIAETELHYDTPYQLLVAVILSAQCTDKRINMVTPALFEAFPTPYDMATATADDIFPFIKSVSYPNNKAKSLAGMARVLCENFNGEVPDNIDDLMKIPGVGRKTANVMLAVVFNKAAMAVDTHVFRVSERIGLTTNSKTPLQTEQALMKHIPADLIPKAHHWLILHGRYVCKARKPDCLNCGLTQVCRYYSKQ
ncbi:MAG: endonuclease III [Paramuribaculum sp.]|nr:endonuclease III [Paramuribaculum sp.]